MFLIFPVLANTVLCKVILWSLSGKNVKETLVIVLCVFVPDVGPLAVQHLYYAILAGEVVDRYALSVNKSQHKTRSVFSDDAERVFLKLE